MDDLPSRIVIREEAFEDELGVLIRDAEAADEYIAAAETVLALDPLAGVLFAPGPPEVWTMGLGPIEGRSGGASL
jgi:hypothetical protein